MEDQGPDPSIQNVKKRRFGLPQWLRPSMPHKRTVIAASLLILAGTGAAYYFYVYKPTKKVANDQCSTQKVQDGILRDAAVFISGQKIDDLGKMVKKVQQIPGYENDQNCLYPIVKYYTMIGDSKKSRDYYDKFLKVYDAKKGIAPIFGPNAGKSNELKDQVESREKQRSEAEKNSFYGPEVSQ